MTAVYDQIGTTYPSTRQPDARIASRIQGALSPSSSVLNVGAGTGSYEPADLHVIAIEPSATMVAQRNPHAAPAIRAVAEALPFASKSFDSVLGVLTMHHWSDLSRGLDECKRVARKNVVFFTWDPNSANFWLVEDYFPQILDQARDVFPTIDELTRMLGGARVMTVPIPADCVDGFLAAYWKRPEAYLDAKVRRGISAFAFIDDIDESLKRLQHDVESGEWHRRCGAILHLDELDLGCRLVVADVG